MFSSPGFSFASSDPYVVHARRAGHARVVHLGARAQVPAPRIAGVSSVLIDVLALLLDLANILGGVLLASALLPGRLPESLAPLALVVGLVALAAGGYWVVVHVTSGPHLFHFEIVGLAVGALLLWDRFTGRTPAWRVPGGNAPGAAPATAVGPALLVGVLGVIAVVVGLQGLVTPN